MQSLFKLILPLGITTYVLLLISLLMGLFKAPMKSHKIVAIATFVFATCHAALILIAKLS